MILATLCILIALLRLLGVKTLFFQAIAHFVVGGLYFGAYCTPQDHSTPYSTKNEMAAGAVILTLIEMYCAFGGPL